MYEGDLALNNLQELITHKNPTQPTDKWMIYLSF